MEIVTKYIKNIPALFLKGRLDALGANELEKEVAHVSTESLRTLILDFEHVDYLSSAGIRVLLALHKNLKERGGSLRLTSLSSFPLQVLEIAGFANVFSIKANLKEALGELVEVREKAKIISLWEELPRYRQNGGIYTFLSESKTPTWLELSGDISDILHAQCSKDDLFLKSFSGNEYSIGVGALGKDTEGCLKAIGEMITLKKIIAWLPIQEPTRPDFLILKKSEQKIPGHTLFDVGLKGKFNQVVALEAEDRNTGIRLDNLYSSLFGICREHCSDFKGVLGLVALANVVELYSGGIKELPISSAPFPRRRASKDWRWIENLSQEEIKYRNVTALVVGVAVNLEADLSCYDYDALRSLFYLHPLHTKGKTQLLHNHSIVFPYLNFSLRNADLEGAISGIVESEKVLDVKRLLGIATISKALLGLFFIQEVNKRKEKHLIIKIEGKAPQLSPTHSLIARKLFADCKELKLYPLGGGFSGSRVFRVASWDRQGRKQMPMVMKIGSLDEVQREIEAFEKYVKKFILNNATNLVDCIIQGEEGGLAYNFVGLSGPDVQISSLDEFYRCHSTDEILPILNVLFRNILKLWYRQPVYGDLPLYREYNFARNLPLITDCAKKELSTEDKEKWIKFPGIQRKFINPLYVVKNSFPERLNEEFSSYRAIVHGDLNLRNILLDNKSNVWIIDFSETHQGHILQDLVKLEATIKFESFDVGGWDELKDMLRFEEEILKPEKFEQIPQITFSLKSPWMEKIYRMVQRLREFANVVTLLEEDISQYYLALLYLTLQVLRYPQISEFTKRYAFLSASLICEKLK
jgi:anti-anti-sigma factor